MKDKRLETLEAIHEHLDSLEWLEIRNIFSRVSLPDLVKIERAIGKRLEEMRLEY